MAEWQTDAQEGMKLVKYTRFQVYLHSVKHTFHLKAQDFSSSVIKCLIYRDLNKAYIETVTESTLYMTTVIMTQIKNEI